MSEQFKRWLLSGLLIAGLGGVACGGGGNDDDSQSGDSSGLPRDKMLGQLSSTEKSQLCEWSIGQMDPNGTGSITCDGAAKQTASAQDCENSEYFKPGTCATVELFEACVNGYKTDPCQKEMPQACEDFYAALMDDTNPECKPPNGIAAGCESVVMRCYCYDTPSHVTVMSAATLDELPGVGDICQPPPFLAGQACYPCTAADRFAALQACQWEDKFPTPPPPDPSSQIPPSDPSNFPEEELKCWYIPGLENLCQDCLDTGKVRSDCTKCNLLDAIYTKKSIKDKKKDKCKDDDKDLEKEMKNCGAIPGLTKLCAQCTEAGNARNECRACENLDRITAHWAAKNPNKKAKEACDSENPDPCPADTCCEPSGSVAAASNPSCTPVDPCAASASSAECCAVNPYTPECCPECYLYLCPTTRMRYGYYWN